MNALLRLVQPADLPELSFPNPATGTRRELGPKQLAWCRRVIPGFRASKRDADRAIAHATRILVTPVPESQLLNYCIAKWWAAT